MSEKAYARIVPATKGDGPQPTTGTQVMVGGVPMAGVTKLVLTAVPNGLWEAEIHCLALPSEVGVLATIKAPKPDGWLSRLCRWIAGPAHGLPL